MRLEQVAERAGVAVDTARRALRHEPSVRPYIKERVLKAAQDLNYHPNLVARALRDKNLNFIPILVPRLCEYYFGELASQIAEKLVAMGMQPALCIDGDHLLKMSTSFSTQGCILVNGGSPEDIQVLSRKQKVVAIGNAVTNSESVKSLFVDFPSAYQHLADTLVQRGRRRIAVVSSFYARCLRSGWPLQKFPTLFEAIAKQGLKPVRPKSLPVFSSVDEFTAWIQAKPGSIDVAICENDLEASHIVGEMAALGLRTPQDILVVGCDANCKLKGTWSVKLDSANMADVATATLKKMIDGEAAADIPLYIPEIIDEFNNAIPTNNA